jgi:hypothetical protein
MIDLASVHACNSAVLTRHNGASVNANAHLDGLVRHRVLNRLDNVQHLERHG